MQTLSEDVHTADYLGGLHLQVLRGHHLLQDPLLLLLLLLLHSSTRRRYQGDVRNQWVLHPRGLEGEGGGGGE